MAVTQYNKHAYSNKTVVCNDEDRLFVGTLRFPPLYDIEDSSQADSSLPS